MTDEERQRTIEFIIGHQAQLTVSQQKTDEILAALLASQAKAEERSAGTEERVSRLETAMSDVAVAQEQMLRAQTHMNEVVAVMADAQTRTDERLNALIGVAERHIGHGHNGQSESK